MAKKAKASKKDEDQLISDHFRTGNSSYSKRLKAKVEEPKKKKTK